MAQNPNGMSGRNLKLEYSLNNSTWLDISGSANSVKTSGGERQTGEEYTFDGDTAAVAYGKRKPTKVKIKVIYSEGASDAPEILRASYENATDIYFRWSPKGQTTGTFLYTCSAGKIITDPYPDAEAKSADLITIEVDFITPLIAKSTNA
jgi:hypothetical protein